MYRAFAFSFLVAMTAGSIAFGLNALPAHAQLASTDPITLDVEPQYPVPYQVVTITPTSNTFDMSAAMISVTVNGTAFYKGTGGAPINVPVGGPGSIAAIVIKATVAGQAYSTEVDLQPADVAIIQEPVSSTHPFYEGAGLTTSNSPIRIIAIPDLRTGSGKILDPSTLEYTWKFGDQVLEDNSGIGKSVLTASAPQQYRDADIQVTVTNPSGTEIAQADTTVSPVDPFVRIYENDPLQGPLYDNALQGTFTMAGTEDTYRGVPYYFSEAPTLSWLVNGTQSGTDNDVTVRATGNGQGTAVLDFSANQSDAALTADSTLSVNFGQAQSAGLFGL